MNTENSDAWSWSVLIQVRPQLFSSVRVRCLNVSRVRRRDDHADRFLVEAFEAALALEILEMAADCTVAQEQLALRRGDEPLLAQSRDAFRAHPPAFSFGERLPQKVEIGKRLHRIDALLGELIAEPREIETRLEVMHARLEKTVAV